MSTVNIHEAKTQLSKLIRDALAGEEVIISKSGRPLVKLVVVEGVQPKRTLGGAEGLIEMTADFDAPLNDFSEYCR